jgi:aminopeptidase N
MFIENLTDSSYTVSGNALEALAVSDPGAAYEAGKKMVQQPAKGKLMNSLIGIMIKNNDEPSFNIIAEYFGNLPMGQSKFELVKPICDYIAHINETEKVKTGIDKVTEFRNAIPEQYGIAPVINGFMNGIVSKKEAAKSSAADKNELQEQIDYIKLKISEEKKGF